MSETTETAGLPSTPDDWRAVYLRQWLSARHPLERRRWEKAVQEHDAQYSDADR